VATQRFAIEFERRTVGIAVRVPGGFVFYASDDRFSDLDGRLFGRVRAIERQLVKFASGEKPPSGMLQPSPALS
jgi:hypothetical protein